MSRRSIRLQIEPSILKYARYYSGYEIPEVAKKIGVSVELLTSLESEKGEISIAKLEKLAGLYKMPLAFFFLNKIPKDVVLPKDFRFIYASEEKGFSPKVMLAIRRARYVQAIVQELSDHRIGYKLREVSLDDKVEKIASYFRSVLGVTIEEQGKWPGPSTALRNWKDAVERLNFFVLQQSLPEEDVSAFCIVDRTPYVIVLNSSEHENRRIFSLFHEIGHILLHKSGVCTPHDLSKNSFEYIRIEKFCNQFAASLLVPYRDFVEDATVQRISRLSFDEWQPEDIKTISRRFRVSQEVIYRRLVTVGVLSEAHYEAKREDLIEGFEEYKKKKKDQKVIVPQYRKIISQNGRAYSLFILSNLHSSRITLAAAADYLDTNSRHISKVETNI